MATLSFQDLALPCGFIRWIHSTHKTHLTGILEKGFQSPQLILSSAATPSSTTTQFVEQLEKYFSPEEDERFRLGPDRPNIALIIDLPNDISRRLDSMFSIKPGPPEDKTMAFNQGETGFYIPPCFIKAVCHGDRSLEIFKGPTDADIQAYRQMIAAAQNQKPDVTKPSRPIDIPKPTAEGPDVW